MDNKTKDALKQLQAEMRQLHTLIAESRPEQSADSAAPEDAPPASKTKSDAVVTYSVQRSAAGKKGTAFKTGTVTVTEAQILKATDESAALLGYALSSPQKVSLLRGLLGQDTASAAALGAAAGLSTGSLYHHLRDLMHAGLLVQAGRSRYQITPRGQRVLLLLLALTLEDDKDTSGKENQA